MTSLPTAVHRRDGAERGRLASDPGPMPVPPLPGDPNDPDTPPLGEPPGPIPVPPGPGPPPMQL